MRNPDPVKLTPAELRIVKACRPRKDDLYGTVNERVHDVVSANIGHAVYEQVIELHLIALIAKLGASLKA